MPKSPISWVGGKYRLADKIIQLFPEHTLYVEPFGGAAHVLFAKPPSKAEIYNDVNRNLVCFFSTVKNADKCAEICRKIESTPYSRNVFERCRDSLRLETLSETERAYCFIVVNAQCFGGLMESWGVNLSGGKIANTFHNRAERLRQSCDRLKNVQMECKDFRYILKRYDRPATLFYLDPPYAWDGRSTREVYADEMTQDDHRELVGLMLNIKGKAILSGYDTPLYEPLVAAGCEKISLGDMAISVTKKVNGAERLRKQEFVWLKR